MATERNGKLRFNLFVTLVLALIVTGFGKPGFLLGFAKPKPPKVPQEATVAPPRAEPRGHSDPFSIEPLPGITISADKDALDRNRDFKLTELGAAKQDELQEQLLQANPGCFLFDAWELDAGLSDDEVLPGVYSVAIDLASRGIPEKYWNLLTACRIDAGGVVHKYITWIENGVLRCEACQNSLLCIAILGGVMTAVGLYAEYVYVYDGIGEGKLGYWSRDGTFNVLDPDNPEKVLYTVVYSADEMTPMLKENLKVHATRIQHKALQMANDNIRARGFNPYKYDDAKRKALILKYREELEQTDEEYKEALHRYQTNADKAARKLAQQVDGMAMLAAQNVTMSPSSQNGQQPGPALVAAIGMLVLKAHNYLKTLGIRMPVEGMEIRLGNLTVPAYAVTMAPIVRDVFISVNLDKLGRCGKQEMDELLLTLTHEMFHACTYRYIGFRFTNTKFNEATGQYLEETACKYFRSHDDPYLSDGTKTITTPHGLTNGLAYQYFGMPFDLKKVTYYDWREKPETWKLGKTESSDAGYPIARFLEYLDMTYGECSFKTMLESYAACTSVLNWGGKSLIAILKQCWGQSDEELTQAFLGFAKDKRTAFYKNAQVNGLGSKWDPVYPDHFLGTNDMLHVKLKNYDYDIRIRHVTSMPRRGTRVANLLALDKNFGDLSDMTLMPLGSNAWTKCKHGIFFYPHAQGHVVIMEIDGGTNPSKSAESGYSIYQLEAPEMGDVVAEEGLLSFTLPEMSQAAKDGKIDGYRVTIKCSDGTTTVKYPRMAIAGKTVKMHTSRLRKKEHDDDTSLTYTVSVCEYIRDGNRKLFGPESDDESDMDDLLDEMGAMEGEITASIYWPSKDDLDLHCNTPDGSHIYYGNKSAGGGTLDVDMQVQGDRDSGVENIFFADPDAGAYEFYVKNFRDRTEGDTTCRVRIKAGNQILVDETVTMGDRSRTWKINYRGNGREENVEILEDSP